MSAFEVGTTRRRGGPHLSWFLSEVRKGSKGLPHQGHMPGAKVVEGLGTEHKCLGSRWEVGRKRRMGIAVKGPQSQGGELGLDPGPGILDPGSGRMGIVKPAPYFKKN